MCTYDNITVYESSGVFISRYAKPKVYCGRNPPGPIRSKDSVDIVFVTDYWITKKGFKFSYISDSKWCRTI